MAAATTTSSASVRPSAAGSSLPDGGTGLTSASRRASTSSSGARLAMRCGLSGSTAMAVSLLYCQGWRNLLAHRRERGIALNAARSHGREDHQSARAEMSPAGVARAQGADRAENRRRADRRMHGSAHRDRYPEPAEPDR